MSEKDRLQKFRFQPGRRKRNSLKDVDFGFNEDSWSDEARRLEEEANAIKAEAHQKASEKKPQTKTPPKTKQTNNPNVNVPNTNPIQTIKGKVEAVLFVTNRPMQIMEISEIVGADDFDVEESLMELMNDYAFREGSALEVDDSDGYILQVKEDFKPVLDTMMPMELTPGALRTLSAIAIKGPLLQSDLVELRGSTVYDHIPELVTKKLITKNRAGRSYRLKVTKNFHEYFKLRGDKKELEIMMGLINVEIPTRNSDRSYEDLTGNVEVDPDVMAASAKDFGSLVDGSTDDSFSG